MPSLALVDEVGLIRTVTYRPWTLVPRSKASWKSRRFRTRLAFGKRWEGIHNPRIGLRR
jgi:hypothetical protein